MTIFKDRYDAGRRLGETLKGKNLQGSIAVVAISREGVPVASEAAKILKAPLYFLTTEKILLPEKTAIPLGAVALEDAVYLQEHIVRLFTIGDEELTVLITKTQQKVKQNMRKFHSGKESFSQLRGRTVILVDDVLTSPVVPTVAAEVVDSYDPLSVILAIPACDTDVSAHLDAITDDIICLVEPQEFHTPVLWYEERKEVTDKDIMSLLGRQSPQQQL